MAAAGGAPPTVSPFTAGGGGSGPGGPPLGPSMPLYQQGPPNSSLPPGMRVRSRNFDLSLKYLIILSFEIYNQF